MDKNKRFSHQDFTNRSLLDVPPDDLNGTVIVGSCFYQEAKPDEPLPRDIFPKGMTGVTFQRCNLDNVCIPPGNTFVDCTMKRIRWQNDGDDWILDAAGQPVEPVRAPILRKQGKPVPRPEDLPAQALTAAELEKREEVEQLTAQIERETAELAAKRERLNALTTRRVS